CTWRRPPPEDPTPPERGPPSNERPAAIIGRDTVLTGAWCTASRRGDQEEAGVAQARVAQPVARVDVVTDTRFGVRLPDPYRWMEQGGPEFDTWMAAQGAWTDEYLAAVPEREELLARVTALTAGTVSLTSLATAGDKVFYLRQSGDDGVPVLVVREGDAERVLLDPATLPGDEHSSLDWYVPDHDGTRIACGISRGGSERSALHTLDVATGALTDEGVPGIARGVVSWYPDGSRLLIVGI